MSEAGKLSLYKQASPLKRRPLVQGKLHTPSPPVKAPALPCGGDEQSVPMEETSGGSPLINKDKTTPTTNTTEVWLPEVQVIRHMSPRELPQCGASGWRFSSDFVTIQPPSDALLNSEAGVSQPSSPNLPPPVAHEKEGRGEEVAVGREAVPKAGHPPLEPAVPASIQSQAGSQPCGSSTHIDKKKPRKGKGRVVPSRYMSIQKQAPSTARKTLPVNPPTSLTRAQASRKLTKSGQKQSKTEEESFKKPPPLPRTKSNPVATLSVTLPQPFTPSSLTSSTPKVSSDSSYQRPHTGTILQDSLTELSNISTAPRSTTKNRSKAQSSSSQSSDLESELLYCRLLQATYLDVMSAKALREQEEKAKTQLCQLWEEVEGRRSECASLRRELETVKRTTALSALLDAQIKELSPVINKLPQLQQYHSALAQSLDTTRHELPTSGLLPITEQQLEAELARSEHTMTDILTSIRHKVPTVTSFADSTEAAVATLDKEFHELERCWKELSSAMRLQVHETSLTFEKKQRQRTLTPTPPRIIANT